jgi:hypothetical protein
MNNESSVNILPNIANEEFGFKYSSLTPARNNFSKGDHSYNDLMES